jgi:hypothetical protein
MRNNFVLKLGFVGIFSFINLNGWARDFCSTVFDRNGEQEYQFQSNIKIERKLVTGFKTAVDEMRRYSDSSIHTEEYKNFDELDFISNRIVLQYFSEMNNENMKDIAYDILLREAHIHEGIIPALQKEILQLEKELADLGPNGGAPFKEKNSLLKEKRRILELYSESALEKSRQEFFRLAKFTSIHELFEHYKDKDGVVYLTSFQINFEKNPLYMIHYYPNGKALGGLYNQEGFKLSILDNGDCINVQ